MLRMFSETSLGQKWGVGGGGGRRGGLKSRRELEREGCWADTHVPAAGQQGLVGPGEAG